MGEIISYIAMFGQLLAKKGLAVFKSVSSEKLELENKN
jgi:hypothetical protein